MASDDDGTVAPDPVLSADGRRTAAQYDAMARDYATANATSPFNAYYERPAMISMLGDVEGLRVLEVGCGAGPLTEWLVQHGAKVTAIDVSPAMVGLARDRLGTTAEVLVADLSSGLGFAADASFDLVVASLVLHYLEDWDSVLGEVRRVLRPSGRFLFSTHHPTADARLHSPQDYFATLEVTEEWGGWPVSFWRRPLRAHDRVHRRLGLRDHRPGGAGPRTRARTPRRRRLRPPEDPAGVLVLRAPAQARRLGMSVPSRRPSSLTLSGSGSGSSRGDP